jgi:hypothetical protein
MGEHPFQQTFGHSYLAHPLDCLENSGADSPGNMEQQNLENRIVKTRLEGKGGGVFSPDSDSGDRLLKPRLEAIYIRSLENELAVPI